LVQILHEVKGKEKRISSRVAFCSNHLTKDEKVLLKVLQLLSQIFSKGIYFSSPFTVASTVIEAEMGATVES